MSTYCEICDRPLEESDRVAKWLPSEICQACSDEHEADLASLDGCDCGVKSARREDHAETCAALRGVP